MPCPPRWRDSQRGVDGPALLSYTRAFRALSSAGEHTLHTGGVVGSIPTAPTIYPPEIAIQPGACASPRARHQRDVVSRPRPPCVSGKPKPVGGKQPGSRNGAFPYSLRLKRVQHGRNRHIANALCAHPESQRPRTAVCRNGRHLSEIHRRRWMRTGSPANMVAPRAGSAGDAGKRFHPRRRIPDR